MIIIEKAEFENFLSFEGKHEYVFHTNGMHFIRGINKDSEKLDGFNGALMINQYSVGSGKTSFTQICLWALFGEITKKSLNKDDVINKNAERNCSVKLWFNKDNVEFYRVERYRKHSEHKHGLLLFKKINNKWENISYEDNEETQQYINKITKFNDVTFRRTSIFHRDDTQHFMELNNAKRSALFENITTQFENLQRYLHAVKKRKKIIAEQIQEEQMLFVKEKTIIEQNVKLINDAKEFYQKKDKEINNEIINIQKQIDDLLLAVEAEDFEILKDNIKQYTELKQIIKNMSDVLTQCDNQVKMINEKIQHIQKSISFTLKQINVKENELINLEKIICDNCGHVLEMSSKTEERLKNELYEHNKHLLELTTIKNEHENELKQQIELKKSYELNLNNYKQQIDNLKINNTLKELIENNDFDIIKVLNEHRVAIELNYKTLETYKKNYHVTVKKALNEINNNKNNIANIKNRLEALHEQETYAEFWNEKLNIREEASIKQFLMLNIIPVFNLLLQKIVDYVYHGDLTIVFDSYFNETMIKNGHEYKYHELSTGEKLKLNLCISLAIFDLMRINMSGCSILFIDEILTNVDEPTIKSFLNLFAEKYSKNSAVYIISHQENVRNNMKPKTITHITKEFDKSTIIVLNNDGEIDYELD